MSARTYSLTVVGDVARPARGLVAARPTGEQAVDLQPALGILTGIGLSLVFWVALAFLLF